MGWTVPAAASEAEIRELLEARAAAVRAKDVASVIEQVAPEVLAYDVVGPLRHSGSGQLRQRAEQWLSSFRGPLGYEIRDLCISAGEDVAFSYSLNRVVGTLIDGTRLDMWWRSTTGFRKIDGRWRITHEHNSVPFAPDTGKASLDLQP
jgi:ketosteroid isomerase-like protein